MLKICREFQTSMPSSHQSTRREILDIFGLKNNLFEWSKFSKALVISPHPIRHPHKARHYCWLTTLYAKVHNHVPVYRAVWKLMQNIFGITYIKCSLAHMHLPCCADWITCRTHSKETLDTGKGMKYKILQSISH